MDSDSDDDDIIMTSNIKTCISSGENEKEKGKTGYGDNQKLFELIYLQAIISVIDKKRLWHISIVLLGSSLF